MHSQDNLIPRTQISEQVNGTPQTVQYQGKLWQTVNSTIDFVKCSNTQWVSVGSGMFRERLFFDSTSPLVEFLKKRALHQCRGKSIAECLQIVNKIINSLNGEEMTVETELKREKALGQFLQNEKTQRFANNPIDLNMDKFVEKQLLVCRHKGLLAVTLIAFLVKQGILPWGKVRQYRSTLKQDNQEFGAHTWAIYRDCKTGHLWLCDPQWNIVAKVTDTKEENLKKYGNVTVNEMIRRIDREDFLKPFVNAINQYLKSPHMVAQLDVSGNKVFVAIKNHTSNEAIQYVLRQHHLRFEEASHYGKKLIVIDALENANFSKLNVKQFINDCFARAKKLNQYASEKVSKTKTSAKSTQFLPAFQQKKFLIANIGHWKMKVPLMTQKKPKRTNNKSLTEKKEDVFQAYKHFLKQEKDSNLPPSKNKPLVLRPPYWRP